MIRHSSVPASDTACIARAGSPDVPQHTAAAHRHPEGGVMRSGTLYERQYMHGTRPAGNEVAVGTYDRLRTTAGFPSIEKQRTI